MVIGKANPITQTQIQTWLVNGDCSNLK